MKSKVILVIFMLTSIIYVKSQASGNQVYQSNYQYSNKGFEELTPQYRASETSQTYTIQILNNVMADSYLVTFGLSQEEKTLEECHKKMNERIDAFKKDLSKLRIPKEAIYVDYISQTKIYDYNSETKNSEVKSTQIEKGFELKKNIIIKFSTIDMLDDLSTYASQHGIYNLVKVEYVNTNTTKIYDEMLKEMEKLYRDKQQTMQGFGIPKLSEIPVINIKMYCIQPKKQYASYAAYETSEVRYEEGYYSKDSHFLKKEMRKDKTFYFDGKDTSSFDLVMNADTPIVGLQYVMEATISLSKKEEKKPETPKKYHFITSSGEIVEIPQ